MKALTAIFGTRASDEAWRSRNDNLASRRRSSEVDKPRGKRYANTLKTVTAVLVIVANQQAGAMEYNPYAGMVEGHNAMLQPPLSLEKEIGGLPVSRSVNGIEQAFHVASNVYSSVANPRDDIEQWMTRGCLGYCDNTPESLNFIHFVAVVLWYWYNKFNPEGAQAALELLNGFDYGEAFDRARTHNMRDDVDRHINGFGLRPLIAEMGEYRAWRYSAGGSDRGLHGRQISWRQGDDTWPYALALLATAHERETRHSIGENTAGLRGSHELGVRGHEVAENAVALALCVLRGSWDYEGDNDLTLAAHVAKVALSGNARVGKEPDNPVRIYLELRDAVCKSECWHNVLNNECTCELRASRSPSVWPRTQARPPIVYHGQSVAEALNEQPSEQGKTGEYIYHRYLPAKPAIEIQRFPDTDRKLKDNRQIEVSQWLSCIDGRWCGDRSVNRAREYRLTAAMLQRSDIGKFSLIVWRDDWADHDTNDQDDDGREWELFGQEGRDSVTLRYDDASKCVSGNEDASGDYNAILAIYSSTYRKNPVKLRPFGAA
jgi:hypothetical protein